MKTVNLNFVKLAGYWFAHLPEYDEGGPEDLVMVEGADDMCESLNKNQSGYVKTTLCDEWDRGDFDLHLEFINSTLDGAKEVDGANYLVSETGETIWLCNVTKYVFDNKFPADIYIVVHE